MEHKFIFICRDDHLIDRSLAQSLSRPHARSLIDNQTPAIANCDQFIDIDIDDYLAAFDPAVDGMIMTMTATDEKWSFVRLNQRRQVAELQEKQVISNEATVGIYNFSKGSDFVTAADSMIAKNIRTNNEFYVAPVYNFSIGKKIDIFNIGEPGNGNWPTFKCFS